MRGQQVKVKFFAAVALLLPSPVLTQIPAFVIFRLIAEPPSDQGAGSFKNQFVGDLNSRRLTSVGYESLAFGGISQYGFTAAKDCAKIYNDVPERRDAGCTDDSYNFFKLDVVDDALCRDVEKIENYPELPLAADEPVFIRASVWSEERVEGLTLIGRVRPFFTYETCVRHMPIEALPDDLHVLRGVEGWSMPGSIVSKVRHIGFVRYRWPESSIRSDEVTSDEPILLTTCYVGTQDYWSAFLKDTVGSNVYTRPYCVSNGLVSIFPREKGH